MSEIQVIQQSFSPEFYAIQAKFNPKAKVPWKLVMNAKNQILEETGEKSEKAEGTFSPEMLEIATKLKLKSDEAKQDLQIKVIGLFYNCSLAEVENLDFSEIDELWEKIAEVRSDLIDFLKLKTNKNQNT